MTPRNYHQNLNHNHPILNERRTKGYLFYFLLILTIAIIPSLLWAQPALLPKAKTLSVKAQNPECRTKISINENWQFALSEANLSGTSATLPPETIIVNIPHTWNAKDAFDDVKGYHQGTGWYRKNLIIPKADPTKSYYLFFEGANLEANVYVNGKHITQHKGGYTAFSANITSSIKDGLNMIAVSVNNANAKREIAPLSADFTFYGGIYRDVYLITVPKKAHFSLNDNASSGIYISTPNVNKQQAIVKLDALIDNLSTTAKEKVTIRVNLLNSKGQAQIPTQEKSLSINQGQNFISVTLPAIKQPHLWSPDTAYLYTLVAEIITKNQVIDKISAPIGLRYFGFDTLNRFLLNGKVLKLIGANRHQDRANIGNALSDDQHREDVDLLKEAGFNMVRIAHYPQDPAFLEACSQKGLLAWEEIPIVNETENSQAFFESSHSQLKDMIKQHCNYPSVVMWGFMNEVYLAPHAKDTNAVRQEQLVSLKLAKQLDSLAQSLDKGRFTTMALHNSKNYNKTGISNITNVIGWNLYHGWYHDKFEDFGPYLDAEHKKYPSRKLIISEFGGGYDTRLHSAKPSRFDFTAEYATDLQLSYLKQMADRPWLAGFTVWNLVDFGSEGRKESMPHINNKGLVTMDRRRKDQFFLYKANFNPESMVYIASRDYPSRKVRFDVGQKVALVPVRFYTNGKQLTVFVNNNQVINTKMNGFTHVQNLLLKPGNNRIVALGDMQAQNTRTEDVFEINVEATPLYPNTDTTRNFSTIALNLGSDVDIIDPTSTLTWEAERPYIDGSFGYIGGKQYRKWASRIGVSDEIFGTSLDPLFQTSRDSITALKFDLPAGRYQVELCFAETNGLANAIVYDLINNTSQKQSPQAIERVFSVNINKTPFLDNFNITQQYGFNTAISKKTEISIKKNEGITIDFVPIKGNTSISGVVIRKLSGF